MNEIKSKEMDLVSHQIRRINRSAQQFFEYAVKEQMVKKYMIYPSGILASVETEKLVVIYLVFDDETNDLKAIDDEVTSIMKDVTSKELCLNVYLKNKKIIEHFKNKGFKTDMQGIEFEYSEEVIPLKKNELTKFRDYNDNLIDDYLKLFDESYNPVNLKIGKGINQYQKYREYYKQDFIEYSNKNNFKAMYLNEDLIGAYTLYEDWISDLVITPSHQGKGYGALLLQHAIDQIMNEKGYNKVYLRTEDTNEIAQRFYLKNGFKITGEFAEHTYKPEG